MTSECLGAMKIRFTVTAVAFLLSAVPIARSGENVILRFNQTLGTNPTSGLVSDAAGNLYGSTTRGGTANCGSVFELSPGSDGKWMGTVIYSFPSCPYPGLFISGTMVLDKQGNLYGVVQPDYDGDGGESFIFELTKGANSVWSKRVIYTFTSSEGDPSELAIDGAGNLYGTTFANSTTSDGEVFKLSPQTGSGWQETVLYTFRPSDGGYPAAGVTLDSKGNLYGPLDSAEIRGQFYGAVYKLSPQAGGPWRLTILYNFHGNEDSGYSSRLVFDSNGNLYGTAQGPDLGLVFELSPTPGGQWTEAVIHHFSYGSDGENPNGPLVVDASGNVYGITMWGGIGCSGYYCGVVYELSPQVGGTWKETILHPFESAEDGSQPKVGLLLDSSGKLFGTTYCGGGRYGYGTVYEITP